VAQVLAQPGTQERVTYTATDDLSALQVRSVFYRITAVLLDGQKKTGQVLKLSLGGEAVTIQIAPQPLRSLASIQVQAKTGGPALFYVLDMQGKVVRTFGHNLQAGNNLFNASQLTGLPGGMYYLNMNLNGMLTSYRFQVVN
jgi:hypothetical protein